MGTRLERINSELQKKLSDIILFELNEPSLNSYFFTVIRVDCSADLQHAIVFVSILGDKDKSEKGFSELCQHLKKIQKLMANRIRMKFTPKLFLKHDDTSLYVAKIDALLNQIKSGTSL
jgi:ribosome-binding factor A